MCLTNSYIDRLKEFLKCEASGWNSFEAAWLVVASSVIFGLSLYWHDTWYGIISALSGVICVILTGKGKLSAYAFGIVNCVLYGYISYGQALYGETMLNILWYLPLQFYGFSVWKKNMDRMEEVKRLSMGWLRRFEKICLITACTIVYGSVLSYMNDPLPYIDSFTTVASVFAMWLSCRRYAEQWYLWIAIDVLSVYMWWNRYLVGGDNMATLLMWCVFLVNAIYGAIKWQLMSEKEDE